MGIVFFLKKNEMMNILLQHKVFKELLKKYFKIKLSFPLSNKYSKVSFIRYSPVRNIRLYVFFLYSPAETPYNQYI